MSKRKIGYYPVRKWKAHNQEIAFWNGEGFALIGEELSFDERELESIGPMLLDENCEPVVMP